MVGRGCEFCGSRFGLISGNDWNRGGVGGSR